MGKKRPRPIVHLPLADLGRLDHSVFGHLVIAQQSPLESSRPFFEPALDQWQRDKPARGHATDQSQRDDLSCGHAPDQWQRDEPVRGHAPDQRQHDEPSRGHAPDQWQRSLYRSVSHDSAVIGPIARPSPPPPPVPPPPPRSISLPSSGGTEDDVSPSSVDDDLSVFSSSEDGQPMGRRRVSFLVDELLSDIYEKEGEEGRRRRNSNSSTHESDSCSVSSVATSGRYRQVRTLQRSRLDIKGVEELRTVLRALRYHVQYVGAQLVRELKRREAMIIRRDRQYDMVTAFLQAHSEKRSEDTRMRFSAMPQPGDSGFTQWHDAMKMVARLPGGIPPEFRRRLWLTLAEKHLQSRNVDWSNAERTCFNEWSNPDDDELGIQIVKDLHRTGCSLFCGVAAQQNQALLKRVLLAFARWNKAVGYCQGFNMLAAIILQVCDRSDTEALKVMIYLIEGVLPESYFANNLRGLSVDMAVFRDLLRLRLPSLSRHLEQLQQDARDTVTGTSYEPPLTNVFTMQWFLTLFSNCLPHTTVLRVWDLIFLEGNEVLLRTALAIWDTLADRIMAVDSADEFYSIMGVLTREMLEFGLMDTNNLIKAVVRLSLPELPDLRDKYLYNITPWSHTVSSAARRGLRLFHSDDEEETDEDDEKMAVAAAYGLFRSARQRDSTRRDSLTSFPFAPDRERLALDISALKQQYSKLRERQRQAHIILTAACARQPLSGPASGQVAMNHLLLGKSALMSVRGRRGAPPGAVPPPAIKAAAKGRKEKPPPAATAATSKSGSLNVSHGEAAPKGAGETLHWKDASATRKRLRRQSSTGECTVVVPPVQEMQPEERVEEEEEEEEEQREEVTKREGSDREDEDDDDGSSTSTELCDEPDRLSDFDSEEPTSVSEASPAIVIIGGGGGSVVSPVHEEDQLTTAPTSPGSELGPPVTPGSMSSRDMSPMSPVAPPTGTTTTTTTNTVDLMQVEEVVDEELERSFENFVVERRKSTPTPPYFAEDEPSSDTEAITGTESEMEEQKTPVEVQTKGPEEFIPLAKDIMKNPMQIERDLEEDDTEKKQQDILEDLVSRLSTDLGSSPMQTATEDDTKSPTCVTAVSEVEDLPTSQAVPVSMDGTTTPTFVHDIPEEQASVSPMEISPKASEEHESEPVQPAVSERFKEIAVPMIHIRSPDEEPASPFIVCENVEETAAKEVPSEEVLVEVEKTPTFKCEVVLDDGATRKEFPVSSVGDEESPCVPDVMPMIVCPDVVVPQVSDGGEEAKVKTTGEEEGVKPGLDLLDPGLKFNAGRRHSERAMQIIRENNLILQNISQLQSRRPSDLPTERSTRRRTVELLGFDLSRWTKLEEKGGRRSPQGEGLRSPGNARSLLGDLDRRVTHVEVSSVKELTKDKLDTDALLEDIASSLDTGDILKDMPSKLDPDALLKDVLSKVDMTSLECEEKEIKTGCPKSPSSASVSNLVAAPTEDEMKKSQIEDKKPLNVVLPSEDEVKRKSDGAFLQDVPRGQKVDKGSQEDSITKRVVDPTNEATKRRKSFELLQNEPETRTEKDVTAKSRSRASIDFLDDVSKPTAPIESLEVKPKNKTPVAFLENDSRLLCAESSEARLTSKTPVDSFENNPKSASAECEEDKPRSKTTLDLLDDISEPSHLEHLNEKSKCRTSVDFLGENSKLARSEHLEEVTRSKTTVDILDDDVKPKRLEHLEEKSKSRTGKDTFESTRATYSTHSEYLNEKTRCATIDFLDDNSKQTRFDRLEDKSKSRTLVGYLDDDFKAKRAESFDENLKSRIPADVLDDDYRRSRRDRQEDEFRKRKTLDLMEERSRSRTPVDTVEDDYKRWRADRLEDRSRSRTPVDLLEDDVRRRTPVDYLEDESRRRTPIDRGDEEPRRRTPLDWLEDDSRRRTPVDFLEDDVRRRTPVDLLEDDTRRRTPVDVLEYESRRRTPIDLLESESRRRTPVDFLEDEGRRRTPVDSLLESESRRRTPVDVFLGGDSRRGSPELRSSTPKLDSANARGASSVSDAETARPYEYKRNLYTGEDTLSTTRNRPPLLSPDSKHISSRFSFDDDTRPFRKSLSTKTEVDLTSQEKTTDRNMYSYSSTDHPSAKTSVDNELKSKDYHHNAYKPYYFTDSSSSTRRSSSLDETDSSRFKETDVRSGDSTGARSKVFLPLRFPSAGMESKLSPILSRSTEVLSPNSKVSESLGSSLSKSHEDLSPVMYRYKGIVGDGGSRTEAGSKARQRYSWACYESDDRYLGAGDASVVEKKPTLSPPSRLPVSESAQFRPFSDDTSAEADLDLNKSDHKKSKGKTILSPLSTTDDVDTPRSRTTYDSSPSRRKYDSEECMVIPERRLVSRSVSDPYKDSSTSSSSYSRLDTYKSSSSKDYTTTDYGSRYSPYKYPGAGDRRSLDLDTRREHGVRPVIISPVNESAVFPGKRTSSPVRPSSKAFPTFPKSPLKSPTKSSSSSSATFDPFPTRVTARTKPKEVAVKLGLYSSTTAAPNATSAAAATSDAKNKRDDSPS